MPRTVDRLPFGLRRYVIRTNWPIVGVRLHDVVAKSADQAWAKFSAQLRGEKADRREWSIELAN